MAPEKRAGQGRKVFFRVPRSRIFVGMGTTGLRDSVQVTEEHTNGPGDRVIDDISASDGSVAADVDQGADEDVVDLDDLFAAFPDDTAGEGPELRDSLLSRRGYVPLLKVFVQLPRTTPGHRASVLTKFVTGRHRWALILFLLVHAAEPRLREEPFVPLSTWARVLSTPKRPCSTRQVSEALNTLVRLHLINRVNRGQSVKVELLREDGSEKPWERAGTGDDIGPGFFTIPHELFTTGLIDQLGLPGLTMLLIALCETNQTPVFSVPVAKAPQWYGFSERTAERGYGELIDSGVMRVHKQMKRDTRSPIGLRPVHHRTLLGPYETQTRKDVQRNARRRVRAEERAAEARARAEKKSKATPKQTSARAAKRGKTRTSS